MPKVNSIADEVQYVQSAQLCYYAQVRSEALDRIRDEKKASSIAGVVNLQMLHENQRIVWNMDKAAKLIRGGLAKHRRKELPCSLPWLAHTMNCLNGEDCTDSTWAWMDKRLER